MSAPSIARELGLSLSYVYSLLSDPTGEGERRRKHKYLNACTVCQRPCHGKRCIRHPTARRRWTRPKIIEAIQEWEIEHGQPPKQADWKHRENIPEWCPTYSVVFKVFGKGGWNKAIDAAGFEPRPQAPPEWAQASPGDKPVLPSPETLARISEERRALYEEDPDHPMFAGLKEGWDLARERQERQARRFAVRDAQRRHSGEED